MDDEQFYPDWLYKKLIEDDLSWDKKSTLDLDSFLKKYTLHDSHWVGLFHHLAFDRSVTLAFQWDSFWLPDDIKAYSPLVDDWPYLFIKIDDVNEVTTANYADIDGINRAISGAETLDMGGAIHLAIDDVFGGQVNLVFKGSQDIIALNPDGSVLSI
ncbi:hypothetical protein [Spongorhabdus nitratireducens]